MLGDLGPGRLVRSLCGGIEVDFWRAEDLRTSVTARSLREPCANLGAKRQALLEAARTPLVAHWDDDDLYLPWHLTRSVTALLERQAGCVKSAGAWFLVGPRAALQNRGVHHNVFEGSMVFRRDEALDLGGYPAIHSGQAKALMGRFARAGRLYKIADDEAGGVSYVYRWGGGVGHVSGIGNRPDTLARFQARNRDFGRGERLASADLAPYWKALALSVPSFASLR